MAMLEAVFLKNIVLYLPNFNDISTFMRINKRARESVQTLFVNPYLTSLIEGESDLKLFKIHFYFPRIQTIQVKFSDLGFVCSFLKDIKGIVVDYKLTDDINSITTKAFVYPRLVNFKGNIKEVSIKMEQLQRATLTGASTEDVRFVLKNISLFPYLKKLDISIDYESDVTDIEKYINQFIELGIQININYEAFEDYDLIENIRHKVSNKVIHYFYSISPFSYEESTVFVLLDGFTSNIYENYLIENSNVFQKYYYPIFYIGSLIDNFTPFNSLTSISIHSPSPSIQEIKLPKSLIELKFPFDYITPSIYNVSSLTNLKQLTLGVLRNRFSFPSSLTSLVIDRSDVLVECPDNLKLFKISTYTKDIKINKTLEYLNINKLNSSLFIPTTLKSLTLKIINNIDRCTSITSLDVTISNALIQDAFFKVTGGKYISLYRIPPLLQELTFSNCKLVDAMTLPTHITLLNISMTVSGYKPNDLHASLKIPQTLPKVNLLMQFEDYNNYKTFHQSYEAIAKTLLRNLYTTINTIALGNVNDYHSVTQEQNPHIFNL